MKQLQLLVLFTVSIAVNAQHMVNAPWFEDVNTTSQVSKQSNKVTFKDAQLAFNNYWKGKDESAKGSGYKPFKRWENYWKNFKQQDGALPSSQDLWDTYLQVNNINNEALRTGSDNSNWSPLGPFAHTKNGTWSPGHGRVNVAMPDPNNSSTLYVGTPAGGLWKSTNSGSTWATTTDDLPQIGVSGIAIDYNNSNIIYIATGDDDAGDSTSKGVFKSNDGGLTWNTTGLNPGNSPERMSDIYMNPNDSNMLWVATTNGVYKTTNGGSTWTNALGGKYITDIKIKPNDPSVVYAVSSTKFYKSTDYGTTFSQVTSGLPYTGIGRIVMDVTPDNPNAVFLLYAKDRYSSPVYGYKGIYKSSNSGASFTSIGYTSTNIFESTQAWYDMAFAVSDTNENELYIGVLNIWKGTVSGGSTSFVRLNKWDEPEQASYTHADIHHLRFFNGELFAGTDGGFFKSTNGGTSFTNLTFGMQIGQFYRLAVAKGDSNKMVGGLQDNGGHGYNGSNWNNYYGGDGMDVAVDPLDDNKFYGFVQNGLAMFLSNNAGQNLTGSGYALKGEWVTPMAMSKLGELFAADSLLHKYNKVTNTWQDVSPTYSTKADYLEIDEINVNNMYMVFEKKLYKSTNKGLSFTMVEIFSENITSVEVNNDNSSIVYVTTEGTSGGVYKSIDGGYNFTSITGSLPNVTKNIIRHEQGDSDNSLYLGTSLGVFTYNDTTGSWAPYNNNMPNVSVTDIEIHIPDNKIIVSTYGRGVWSSALDAGNLSTNNLDLKTAYKVYPNPSRGVFNIVSSNNDAVNLKVVDITGKVIYNKQEVDFSNGFFKLNLEPFSKGVYFLEIGYSNLKTTEKLVIK